MSTETNERKKELRDAFIDARGYWNEFWDALLDLDEDFFEAYTRFSSVPWLSAGPLSSSERSWSARSSWCRRLSSAPTSQSSPIAMGA